MEGHALADPFDLPGQADLTANVDFAYLAEALAGAGASHTLQHTFYLRGPDLHYSDGAWSALTAFLPPEHGHRPYHLLNASHYATHAQHHTFLTAYLEHRTLHAACRGLRSRLCRSIPPLTREHELIALENAVSAWGPASHAMWAVWGLMQARKDVLANIAKPEFDYSMLAALAAARPSSK